MRRILTALAFTVALATVAQAQSVETLAENMRMSVAHCTADKISVYHELVDVKINLQCVKVQFRALQTYIDAANACLKNVLNKEACVEAVVIEKSLIKTFRSPPKK